jgi:trehalose/maltose hydrolase-like predicted phosphorylase
LTQFWVSYNAFKRKQYKVRGVLGPKQASEAVKKAAKV